VNDDQESSELDLVGAEALLGGSDAVNGAHADLAAVLDGLRQPAQASELAAGADLVPQLAALVRQPVAPGFVARSTRRMMVMGATGAMLAGGVAAAATGALDPILPGVGESAVVEAPDEDHLGSDPVITDPDPVATNVVEAVDDPALVAGLGVEIDEELPEDAPEWLNEELLAICTDPDANHGAYVSEVAGLDDEALGDARNRGEVVSQAARDKDCDGEADGSAPSVVDGEDPATGAKGQSNADKSGHGDDGGRGNSDHEGESGKKSEKDKSDDDDDDGDDD